jgi:hypothetical protein
LPPASWYSLDIPDASLDLEYICLDIELRMLSCKPGLDIPDIEEELNSQADVDNLTAAVERLLGRNPNLAAG